MTAPHGSSQPSQGTVAAKPLYRDPILDGPTDPVVVWNPHVRRWWMFYTSRRANVPGLTGVAWVHGTGIGIAESADGGATWRHVGAADIDDGTGLPDPTHWAPEIITVGDRHHMFLTVVPGVFETWDHPRAIIHLTSDDLRTWRNPVPLPLACQRAIDACVLRLRDGTWRLWYNDEVDDKSVHFADSPDLHTWTAGGRTVSDQPGEGPKAFRWRGAYWMITDVWAGIAVYRSPDADTWIRQPGNLLDRPGSGPDDGGLGHHADVVVNGDRAFIFYFVHPGGPDSRPAVGPDSRRSVVQVAELEVSGGELRCDRDRPVHINLRPPTDPS